MLDVRHTGAWVRARVRRLGGDPAVAETPTPEAPDAPPRQVRVMGALRTLRGDAVRVGDVVHGAWSLPRVRGDGAPLGADSLRDGLAFVSTLPNIHKHACVAQVLRLEHEVSHAWPHARVHHVSADGPETWAELDDFHAEVRAGAYSLALATEASSDAFRACFGVGVEGTPRVAHGLFAVLDGVVLGSEIPFEQMGAADVDLFLERLERLLGALRRLA